jgi:hypothetical protein
MEHIAFPQFSATTRATDVIAVTAERDTVLANGYQPMPVRECGKGGRGALPNEWQKTRGRVPFNPRWTGTGILPLEKTGCIDADIGHDDYETAAGVREIAERILGRTPCVQTRANSARFKLLYQNLPDEEGGYLRSTKVLMPTPPGEKNRAVEYRTGLQYFGAFLVHQSGVPFEWKCGSPLIIKREWLPGVTAEKLAAFLAAVAERFPRPDAPAVNRIRHSPSASARKPVSPFADMSALYQPIWPSDAVAFLREVPNTLALVPSYTEYFPLAMSCHATLRDYRRMLIAQGVAARHVDTIMAAEERRLLEAWCFFANQQPQDVPPERKWDETRNIYDEKNASFIVKLAQQAGYWLPSRRPKPEQVLVKQPDGSTVTVDAKALADRLFAETKGAFKAHHSRRMATARVLLMLVEADPAVARLALHKVAYSLIARAKPHHLA